MKTRLLIICLIFFSISFAQERGDFTDNHCRFVVKHLPQLLERDHGKILLIWPEGYACEKLNELYPSIQFENLSYWNTNFWDIVASDQNWKGTFDCVVALNVLEREQNRQKIIQFISDLLKPGGKVLMYVDPNDEESFSQRIERFVKNSKWKEIIPVIPSLSIPEYQKLIEGAGLRILDQAPDEYKIHFKDSFYAMFSICGFVCTRWPVPKNEWDEELFSRNVKNLLNSQLQVIEIPNELPILNSWIEDDMPTYYFIFKK